MATKNGTSLRGALHIPLAESWYVQSANAVHLWEKIHFSTTCKSGGYVVALSYITSV